MSMPDYSVPETPFAVACPGCHGALAVTTSLAGSAVCCPLCACGFLVPDPRQPQPSAPPRKEKERRPRDRARQETSGGPARSTVRDLDIPSDAPVSAATLQAPPAPMTGGVADAAAADDPAVAAAAPDAASYRFREAGPTIIGTGADAIELRRLTPEEKQARRIRRNLIMLLSGSAVLIVIALIFGRSSGKRRRR